MSFTPRRGRGVRRLARMLACAGIALLSIPLLTNPARAQVSAPQSLQTTFLSSASWSLTFSTAAGGGGSISLPPSMSSYTIVISTSPNWATIYSSFTINAYQFQQAPGVNLGTMTFSGFTSPAPSTGTSPNVAIGNLTLNADTTYYFAIKNSTMVVGNGIPSVGGGTDTNFVVLSTVTFAAPAGFLSGYPSSSFTAVNITTYSVSVQWGANTNAATAGVAVTTYSVVLSTITSAFDATANTPALAVTAARSLSISTQPISFAGGNVMASLGSGVADLFPNTTYFLYVAAASNTVAGAGPAFPVYTLLGSTMTEPAAPLAAANTFLNLAQNSLSVQWNANFNPSSAPVYVSTYSVLLSTANTLAAALTAAGTVGNPAILSTAPFTGSSTLMASFNSGLIPDATYYIYIAPVSNPLGGTSITKPYVSFGSTVTLPNAPLALAYTATFASPGPTGSFASWNANVNASSAPVVSTYSVVYSTISTPAAAIANVGNGLSFNVSVATSPSGLTPGTQVAGLMPNTTYFAYAAALGAETPGTTNGIPTNYVSLGSTVTEPNAPLAAAAAFVNLTQNSVGVQWLANLNQSSAPINVSTFSVLLSTANTLAAALTAAGTVGNPAILSTAPFTGSSTLMASLNSGLIPDATYYLYVAPVSNALVAGAVTKSYVSFGSTVTLPNAPLALAYTATFASTGSTGSFPNWNSNVNASSAPVISTYSVVYSTISTLATAIANVGNGFSFNVSVTTTSSGLTPGMSVTGLMPNTTYSAYVAALGAETPGTTNGIPTNYVALGSTVTEPNPPLAAAATFVNLAQNPVGVQWLANLNQSSAPINVSTYSVLLSTVNNLAAALTTAGTVGNPAILSTAPFTGSSSLMASFTSGLISDATYYLYVAPVSNALVTGAVTKSYAFLGSSATLAAVPAAAAFVSPVTSTFTSVGATQMTVLWTANGNAEYLTNLTTYTVVLSTIPTAASAVADAGAGFTVSQTTEPSPGGGGNLAATFLGLNANTTYYLYVAAVGVAGNTMSAYTALSSTMTPAANPTAAAQVAPVVSTFTSVGTNALTVQWGNDANSAVAPITTTYTVVLSTISSAASAAADAGSGLTVSQTTAPTNSGGGNLAATFTGLTADTTYYFYVAAQNNAANNEGTLTPYVSLGSTATLAAAPTAAASLAPVTSTFTSISPSALTVLWNSNGNNETPPLLTTYTVVITTIPTAATAAASIGDGSGFVQSMSTAPAPGGGNNLSATFTGISANTTWYFYVAAGDAAGNGTNSGYVALSSTMTPAQAPIDAMAPVTSTFTLVTANSMMVQWGGIGNSQTAPMFTTYTVVLSTISSQASAVADVGSGLTISLSTQPVPLAQPPAGTNLAATATGLTANTTYFFYVAAQNNPANNEGLATAYASLSSTVTLPLTPTPVSQSAPVVSSFTSVGATAMTVQWNDGGNSVAPPLLTTYTVVLSTLPTLGAALANVGAGGFTTSVNTAPVNSGGGNLASTFSGLTADTTYYLYVAAQSAAGNGTTSAYVALGSTATLVNAPTSAAFVAPVTSTFTSISGTGMTVIWNADGNDAAPPVQASYTVVLSTLNTAAAAVANVGVVGSFTVSQTTAPAPGGGSNLAGTFSGLTGNTTYFLYVAAVNAAGNGTNSGYVALGSTITAPAIPAPVAQLAPVVSSYTSVSATAMTVQWNNGGNSITPPLLTTYTVVLSTLPNAGAATANVGVGGSFTVSQTTAPTNSGGGNLAATFTGLTADTTYFLYIAAQSAAGNGTTSAYAALGSTATLVASPTSAAFVAPVTSTFTSVTGTAMTVIWNADGNDSTPPILTTYAVVVSTLNSAAAAITNVGVPGSFTVSLNTAPANGGGGNLAATFNPLAGNATFYLYVAAINAAANGTNSGYFSLGSTMTPTAIPTAVAQFANFTSTVTSLTQAGMTVQWNSGGNSAVGPTLTTYTVLLSTIGTQAAAAANVGVAGSFTTSLATAPPDGGSKNLAATFASLSFNATYFIYVAAQNNPANNEGLLGVYTPLGSTATWALAPNAPVTPASTFTAVTPTGMTVQWGNNGDVATPPILSSYSVILTTIPTLATAVADQGAGQFNLVQTTAPNNPNGTMAASFSGLMANTTWFFYVAALNAANNNTMSAYTALSSTMTPAQPPTAPVAPVQSSFTLVAANSMTVLWGGVSNQSPPMITTYTVVLSTLPTTAAAVANVGVAGSFTVSQNTAPFAQGGGINVAASFTGLNANTTYFLYVAAVNNPAENEGTATAYTALSSTVTLPLAPTPVAQIAPVVSSFTSVGATAMTVQWNDGGNSVAPPILTTYTVVLSTLPTLGAALANVGAGGFTTSVNTAPVNSGGGNLASTFSGLTADTTYYLYVAAQSAAGNGTTSAYVALGSTATLVNAPTSAAFLAPVTSTFTSVGGTGMTVIWNADGNDAAPPVQASYTVVLSTLNAAAAAVANVGVGGSLTVSQTTAPAPGGGNNLAGTFSGLTGNTTYFLYVAAVNAAGNGTNSGYVALGSTVTAPAIPAPAAQIAPVVSSYTSVGATAMTVQWNNGGNSITPPILTTYTVVLSTLPTAGAATANVGVGGSFTVSQTTAPTNSGGGNLAATFTGLTADTTYFLYIAAQNVSGAGTSAYAALGSSATLVAAPTSAAFIAPVTSTFTSVTQTQLTVLWNSDGNDATPPILASYTVVVSTLNTAAAAIANVGVSGSSFTVSQTTAPTNGGSGNLAATFGGLNANATYFLYIAAVDAAGNNTGSAYLALSSTMTPAAVPAPPAQLAPVGSTYTSVGLNGMTVVWNGASNSAVGPNQTTYTVLLSTIPTAAGAAADVGVAGSFTLSQTTVPANGGGGNLAATFSSLNADVSYYLYVAAQNNPANNEGLATAYVPLGSSATLAAAPSAAVAPVTSSFTSVVFNGMTVLWNANGNSAVPPILSTYTVILSTVNYSSGAVANVGTSGGFTVSLNTAPANGGSGNLAATLTGLNGNTSYYLYVAAVDAAGNGTISTYTMLGSTLTSPAPPSSNGAIANIATTYLSSASWSLSWTVQNQTGPGYGASQSTPAVVLSTFPAAGTNNANWISSFTAVLLQSSAAFSGFSLPQTLPANYNSVLGNAALYGNTTYYFSIKNSTDTKGSGVAGDPAYQTVSTMSYAGTPGAAATFSSGGSTSLIVTYNANGNAAGYAWQPVNITTFNVVLSTINVSTAAMVATIGAPGSLTSIVASTRPVDASGGVGAAAGLVSATFSGLQPNTTYYYTAAAFNVAALGSLGSTTPYAAPTGAVPASTMTLPNVSSATVVPFPVAVSSYAVTVAWSADGNPASNGTTQALNFTTYTVVFSTIAAAAVNVPTQVQPTIGVADSLTVAATTSPAAGIQFTNAAVNTNGTPTQLHANATYYVYAQAVGGGIAAGANCAAGPAPCVNGSAWTFLGSTVTTVNLATAPVGGAGLFGSVATTGTITVTWGDNDDRALATNLTTYTVLLSTIPTLATAVANAQAIAGAGNGFNIIVTTQPTDYGAFGGGANVGATVGDSTHTIQPNFTYFAYVGAWPNMLGGSPVTALAQLSAANFYALGSTLPSTTPIPTQAATPFPGVFYASMTVSWVGNGSAPGLSTYSVVLSTLATSAGAVAMIGIPGSNTFAYTSTAPTANTFGGLPLTAAFAAGTPGLTAGLAGGLTLNTTYNLYVAGISVTGTTGTYASLGSISTLATPPAVLTGAQTSVSTFSNVSAGQFSMQWSTVSYLAPQSNPGTLLAQTSYSVVLATSNFNGPLGATAPDAFGLSEAAASGAGVKYTTAPVSYNAGPAMFSPSSLQPGASYYVFVAAVNNNGIASPYVYFGSVGTTGAFNAPVANANPFMSAGTSFLSPQWNSNGNPSAAPFLTTYTVVLSSYPSGAGALVSSATLAAFPGSYNILASTLPTGAFPTATFTGLQADTTYYLYVATPSAVAAQLFTQLGSTSTWANPATAGAFSAVWFTSATVTWTPGANPNPAGQNVSTFVVVAATYPTLSQFSGFLNSGANLTASNGVFLLVGQSTAPGAAAGTGIQATLSGATIQGANPSNGNGLIPNSTYYLYVAALDWSASVGGGLGGAVANLAGPLASGVTPAATPAKADAAGQIVVAPSVTANNVVVGWSSGTAPAGVSSGQGFDALNVTTYTVLLTKINGASAFASAPGDANSLSFTTAPAGNQPQAAIPYAPSLAAYPAGSGVLANTTYYAYVQANGRNGTGTPFVEIATVTTFADAPAPLAGSTNAFISVSSGSAVVGWSANGNPMTLPTTTYYSVVLSTVPSIAAGAVSPLVSGNVIVTTVPVSLGNPNPQALTAQIGQNANGTSALSGNTLYYLWVAAYGVNGQTSAYVRLGSTVTAVAPPGSFAYNANPSTYTAPGFGTLTINWPANSNPSGTLYNVVLSSVGAAPAGTFPPAAGNLAFSTAPTAATPSLSLSTTNALGGNTVYYVYINAVGLAGGQSAFVAYQSTETRAVAPLPLPTTNVTAAGFTINWSANGDSAATSYVVQVSTNNFQTFTVNQTVTGVSLAATGLLGGMNYAIRVAANGYDGTVTPFTAFPSATTAGAPVAAPTAAATPFTAISTAGITADWADVVNTTPTYVVQISTDPSFVSFNAGVTTLNKFQSFGAQPAPLNPATPYYFQVQAMNAATGQTSLFTALGGTSTSANAPVNTTTPTVSAGTLWSSSAAITFQNNADPSTTTAEIQLSSGKNSSLFSTWTSSFGVFNNGLSIGGVITSSYTPVSLIGCTQYSARTRFYSPSGAPSAFDSSGPSGADVITFTTPGSTPTAANGLVALPNAGDTITLMWNPSPTEGVSQYNIYADTSGFAVSSNVVNIATGAANADNSRNAGFIVSLTTTALAAAANPAATGTGTNASGMYQFTTAALPGIPPTTPYVDSFKITATHRCGVEETSGAEATAIATAAVAAVRATVLQPTGGAQVAGGATGSNNLTMQANLFSGTPSKIVFQYLDNDAGVASSGTWVVIATVTAAPWSAAFDVTQANGGVAPFNGASALNPGTPLPVQGGGPTGAVSLRAVAYDQYGSSDTSPAPSIVTLINPGAALANLTPGFVQETALVTGEVVKQAVLPSNVASSFASAGGAGGTTLGLTFPAGALVNPTGASFVAIAATPNPPASITSSIPPPAAGVTGLVPTNTGVVTEICLGTLNTNTGACTTNGVQLTKPATIKLSYAVFAGNGDIATPTGGDSGVAPANAAIFSARYSTTAFVGDASGNAADAVNDVISAQTSHFSFFGIFNGASPTSTFGDLSQVRVYPVPWIPHGPNPDQGRDAIPGNLNTGIVFDRLPANATIKIYTILGQLVTSQAISNGNGTAQWDGRNDDGRPVATGGYFAVISSGGNSITKRLAIIR